MHKRLSLFQYPGKDKLNFKEAFPLIINHKTDNNIANNKGNIYKYPTFFSFKIISKVDKIIKNKIAIILSKLEFRDFIVKFM